MEFWKIEFQILRSNCSYKPKRWSLPFTQSCLSMLRRSQTSGFINFEGLKFWKRGLYHIFMCALSPSSAPTRPPPRPGGASTNGFPPITGSMAKTITQSDILPVKWAQMRILCREQRINYQNGGSKGKDITEDEKELQGKLPKAGEEARLVAKDVWDTFLKM